MIKRQYKRTQNWVERQRYPLLLIATLLVLLLPAFSGTGLLSEIVFVTTLTFLFIQSMIAGNVRKSRRNLMRFIIVVIIVIIWLEPVGIDALWVDITKLSIFMMFFTWVVFHLVKFVIRSETVNKNVLITSINIYLLAGIISASLAFMFYRIYPDAFNFPSYIIEPAFVHFIYFSFITMSTVGYGDITPRIPETQTLAYLMAITGQLYVAIVIAFLVGKILVHSDRKNSGNKA